MLRQKHYQTPLLLVTGLDDSPSVALAVYKSHGIRMKEIIERLRNTVQGNLVSIERCSRVNENRGRTAVTSRDLALSRPIFRVPSRSAAPPCGA